MNPHWRVPMFICLGFSLCAGQSTSSTLCTSCSTALACRGCNVNADIITTSSTSWSLDGPASPIPLLQAYLHFTAYSVTLTSSANGICVKQTSSPVHLVDPYIVPVNITVDYQPTIDYYSELTSSYSIFLDDTYSSLDNSLGYEDCTPVLSPSPVVPTYWTAEYIRTTSQAPSLASATAHSTATPVEGSEPVHHVHTTQTIILSVMVPTAGLIILLLSLIAIRKYRKKRSQTARVNQSDTTPNTQLYVDQKAELEDEERRKHELDGEAILYEMQGDDRTFELPSYSSTETRLASFGVTHELGDVEHSQEMEVPSTSL